MSGAGEDWKPWSLFDIAAKNRAARITCRCGHSVVVNAHALWWRFHRKGWDGRLELVRPHLRCEKCGNKHATVQSTRAEATVDRLPLPPEREWKRAVDRYRC